MLAGLSVAPPESAATRIPVHFEWRLLASSSAGGLAGRLEAAVLAALDAAPPDPAAGRVISLFKLRSHLAALPDQTLADYAASKVCCS